MSRRPARARVILSVALLATLFVAAASRQTASAASGTAGAKNFGGWVSSYGDRGVARVHDIGTPRTAAADGRGGVWAGVEDGAHLFVTHVKPSGKPDPAFGDDGRAELPGFAYVYSLVRMGDRVLVIGSDAKPWNEPGALRVLRLTASGSVDPTFVAPSFSDDAFNPINAAGVVLKDGRIAIATSGRVLVLTAVGVVAANVESVPGRPAIAARGNGYVVGGHVLRQDNPNGFEDLFTVVLLAQSSPGVNDTSFGEDGRVEIADDRIPDEAIEDLVVSSAGVLVGTTGASFRVTQTGAPDVTLPGANELALQDDGKVIALTNQGISRFLVSGQPDPSFGANGNVSAYLNTWTSPDNNWYYESLLVTGKLIQLVGSAPAFDGKFHDYFDLVVTSRSGALTGGVPVMKISDTRVWERAAQQYQNLLQLEFDRPPEQFMDVKLRFIDKTAKAATDFYGQQEFTVESARQLDHTTQVGITPRDDNVAEPVEEIGVQIVSAPFAIPGPQSTANVIVVDNSGPKPPAPTVTAVGKPYGEFTGGAFVAAGDLDGDGRAEIVTGADAGGGPHVRVLRANTTDKTLGAVADFFAYDPGFTGGVRVATADIDGDGRAEIVTAPGPGGGPHVRVWRVQAGGAVEVASFMAGDGVQTFGLNIAGGDTYSENADEVQVGWGTGGPTRVYEYTFKHGVAVALPYYDGDAPSASTGHGATVAVGNLQGWSSTVFNGVISGPVSGDGPVKSYTGAWFSFSPYGLDNAGVTVAAGRVGKSGDELLTTPTAGRAPEIRAYSAKRTTPIETYRFLAYERSFRGGVRMAVGDINGDGRGEVITAPGPGRPALVAVRAVPLH